MTALSYVDVTDRRAEDGRWKIAIASVTWVAALSIGLAVWVTTSSTTAPDPVPGVSSQELVVSVSEPEPAVSAGPEQPALAGGYFGPLRSD